MALPTNGFVIHQIPHPVDPQVNGFGFYRTIDEGSSVLLDQRIAIPTNNEYAISHHWENFHLSDLSNTSKLQLQFTYDLDDMPTADQSDTTDNTARGTYIWEPGFDQTQNGSLAHKNHGWWYQNHEETSGYQATYRWEYDGSFVASFTFTWCYTTNVTDASLGVAAVTNNDAPPVTDIVAEFQEQVFLAGNEDQPHRLYNSRRFLPESFPAANFNDVGSASDPIRALEPYIGMIGTFTRDTKYAVTGDSTAGYVPTEAVSRRGIAGKNCHVATERGVIFVARDGVFMTSFVGADQELSAKIKHLFIGKSTEDYSGEDTINWDHADTIGCAYWHSKFYCTYPSTGPNFGINTVPNRMMVFSFETKEWYFYDLAARSLLVEEDNDTLTAGFNDGKVYTLETTSQDDGSDIAMSVETKEFDIGVRSLLLFMKVDAEGRDGLTVSILIDGSTTASHTSTITGSRTKTVLPLAEGTWGHRWKAKFDYTGNQAVRIYGLSMYFLPLSSH